MLADGGSATSAYLAIPSGAAVDSAASVFIADTYNYRVRKVAGGVITTVVGGSRPPNNGDGSSPLSAQLDAPSGIALGSNNQFYIAQNTIRTVSNGVITSAAGSGGAGALDIALESQGNIYMASGYGGVRKLAGSTLTNLVTLRSPGYSGDNGPASSAKVNYPYGIALDSSGKIYIADTSNHRIMISNGTITTNAGTGVAGLSGDDGPALAAQYTPVPSSQAGQISPI